MGSIPLLTVSEFAERLRVSENTVRNWLRSGKVRRSRPGGTKLGWRIPEGEVARIIAAGMPAEGRTDDNDVQRMPG